MERSKKISLGVFITICTLGLALLHKQTKELFTKNRKTICLAMLVTEGSKAYLVESNVQRLFQQFGVQALRHVKNADKETFIALAKLAAQQDGRGTSKHIRKYEISNQETLIEVAKLATQQGGWGTSEYIENYGIAEQTDRIEMAKIVAREDGRGISKYIQNYGITDENALAEIAKIAALQNGWGTSEYIDNYDITNQKNLVEIAKIAAYQDGEGTSEYIKNYDIIDQKALAEIAKIAAQQDGRGTSKYIKNYGIMEQAALIEIVNLAIKIPALNGVILDFWGYLPNYGLSEEELTKSRILYACHYGLNDTENHSMQKFVSDHTKSIRFPSFSVFDQKIAKMEEQILREEDLHKLEKLQRKKQRVSLCFSLVSNKCCDCKISLTEDQQGCIVEAIEYRNEKESNFLTQLFIKNFEKPNYLSNYQELVGLKKHLILPMILVNQLLIESPDPSDVYRKTLTQIEGFLRSRLQRNSLRYLKGFLPNLLQALIALYHFPSISLKQKFYLLNQCFQFALSVKEEEWEVYCKKALDTVNILASMNLLATVLEELEVNLKREAKYGFEDVIAQFEMKLQTDIFVFSKPLEGLYEKYLKMEEALRIPLAFVRYVSNLKNTKEPSVSQKLQQLAIHILEGSVKEERYQIENNPHLQKIQEDFPKIFQAWQISQEAIEIKPREAKLESVNFFIFLKEKILIDKHLPQPPSALIQYLKEPYSIKNMKEVDQPIVLLCKELCDLSVDFTKKLTILKRLFPLVGQNEFKNDIYSLYENLITIHRQKNVFMVDSDDWQDLFLSGTEVLGSCQRIDGDPLCNVCLMAYVLDGKNRILCIKDAVTEQILARCIFRLLFKDNQLVLFQERIYPAPCRYEELLNTLAEIRARELGLELFTCNRRDNLKSGVYVLESLGSCSPYEYADASTGKTNGLFKIYTAKKVNLTSED